MIYLLLFLMLMILSYVYDYKHVTNNKWLWYNIILICLILVAGLRYRIGVDSVRYETGYLDLPDLNGFFDFDFSSTRFAPGYVFMNAIARSISDNFMAMQFIQATFVNCTIFWFFRKYSSHVFFAIFLYYIFLYLNFTCEVMREACAVCFFLIAFPYFVKKNWMNYYFWITVSVLFHNAAFVLYILPILYFPCIKGIFKIKKRFILILLILFVLAVIIGNILFNYIQAFILLDSIQERADEYSQGDLSVSILNINGIIGLTINYILYPFMAYILLRRSIRRNDSIYRDNLLNSIELMLCVGMIIAVLNAPIAIFYRFLSYFIPFSILVISDCIFTPIRFSNKVIKLKYISWILLLTPLLFLRIYIYFQSPPGSNNLVHGMAYYPYENRITEKIDKDRERLFQFHHAW